MQFFFKNISVHWLLSTYLWKPMRSLVLWPNHSEIFVEDNFRFLCVFGVFSSLEICFWTFIKWHAFLTLIFNRCIVKNHILWQYEGTFVFFLTSGEHAFFWMLKLNNKTCCQFSKHRPSGPMFSISQFVHMCVCVCVCLFVHFLRYRLNVFLSPLPEVGCPNFLEIRNPWGFELFSLEVV